MDNIEIIEISDNELNKILIEDFGNRKFLAEIGRIPFMLKWMVKMQLPLPNNIMELNDLYLENKYYEAYETLQKMRMINNKAKWYIDCCLIVLCYFRLNKPEEAKQLIEALSYITSSLPQVVMSIATKVGAKYIPGNVNRSINN